MQTLNESIEVARLFQEVIRLFKHNIKKSCSDTGMSAPQGMIIGLLSKNKKMKITELSKHLSLSNSTVSGMIDRLEAQQMVIRERSKDDKRVVYVSISSNFEEMHKSFHRRFEKDIENIMNQGTKEELQKIFEGLDILKKLLSNEEKK
ncbi:MarR family transcriptional regulator [Clostridium beijerinckii]|nr:MarR family transcriptional regulator [Clostridium beijerinckii]